MTKNITPSRRFIKQINEAYIVERIQYDIWADQINVTSSFQDEGFIEECEMLTLGFFKIQVE